MRNRTDYLQVSLFICLALLIFFSFSGCQRINNGAAAHKYLEAGKYDSALLSFEKAIKKNEHLSADDYVKAAVCAVKTKSDDKAIVLLNHAVEKGLICYESIRDIPEFEPLKETSEWKGIQVKVIRNQRLKENELFKRSWKLIGNNIRESGRLADSKLLRLSASSLYDTLKHPGNYVQVSHTGTSYLFYADLPWIKHLPFKVYVPKGYDARKKYPTVLFMHGASNYFFHSMVADDFLWQDILFKKLCDLNEFLIIQPICDRDKEINWALNSKTYEYLEKTIINTKMMFHVDDDAVFAYGHSDGGRGAFCMTTLKPSVLAGAVSLNMGPSLIFNSIFLKNAINRPQYIVHSDLDDINPVQDTENAVVLLKKSGADVNFRVFKGYRHEDRHLEMAFDSTLFFLRSVRRKPFKKNVYWQTSSENTGCDWIKITKAASGGSAAAWSKPLNFKIYDKVQKSYFNQLLYDEAPHSAVEANFNQNTFNVRCSMVKEAELFISKDMADLLKPITVIVNDKVVFNGIVPIDKAFMISNFRRYRDKTALWVNRITINVAEGVAAVSGDHPNKL